MESFTGSFTESLTETFSSFEIDESVEINDISERSGEAKENKITSREHLREPRLSSHLNSSESELESTSDDDEKTEIIDSSSESNVVLSSDDEVNSSTSRDGVDDGKPTSIHFARNKTIQNITSANNTQNIECKEVTKAVYLRHVAKIAEISDQINQYENLLKFSSHLPDHGEKLKNLVVKLNSDLAVLNNGLKFMSVEEPSNLVLDFQNMSITSTNESEPSFQEPEVDLWEKLKRSQKTMPTKSDLATQPASINGNLMTHQRQALAWMIWREEQFPKGGILADDMGLGKTLTVISLIARCIELRGDEERKPKCKQRDDSSVSEADEDYNGRTLVICPASVIKQWEDEINKFTNYAINVTIHHGDKRATSARELIEHEVVITTYGIVRTEVEKFGALSQIHWERIVLDEAHTIRNYTSKQSLCCCRLQGSVKWALTGTPIQNKHGDVFALMKFLRCSPLDSSKYWKAWTGKKAEDKIGYIMKFLLLRRTKDELGKIGQMTSLPEKKLENILVHLTDDEMKVYEMVSSFSKILSKNFQNQRDQNLNKLTSHRNDENIEKALKLFAISSTISASHILLVILRLRQICIHASLIDAMLNKEDIDDFSNESNVLEELNELTIGGKNDEESKLVRSNPVFHPQRLSSKFKIVLNTLQKRIIAKGEKAVVVSQFTSVLTLFENHLSKHQIQYLKLTGSTKISQRQDIVEHFNGNSEEQILLLSLAAGGVGLNLCGANHLLLIDPHWNPQLESQAEDRIYRIGQTKTVTIYRFICEGTIEERIEKLQERKKGVAKNILSGCKLNIDDMMALI